MLGRTACRGHQPHHDHHRGHRRGHRGRLIATIAARNRIEARSPPSSGATTPPRPPSTEGSPPATSTTVLARIDGHDKRRSRRPPTPTNFQRRPHRLPTARRSAKDVRKWLARWIDYPGALSPASVRPSARCSRRPGWSRTSSPKSWMSGGRGLNDHRGGRKRARRRAAPPARPGLAHPPRPRRSMTLPLDDLAAQRPWRGPADGARPGRVVPGSRLDRSASARSTDRRSARRGLTDPRHALAADMSAPS
jgi:hypothetical protein